MPLHHRFFIRNPGLQFVLTVLVSVCLLCFTLMRGPSVQVVQRRRSLMSIDNVRNIVQDISINGSTIKNPVNPLSNGYIHQPSDICNAYNKNNPSFLLILVKSDASNPAQRMAIRQTWGNITDQSIKIIFLIGYYSIVEEIIDLEANRHKDILQGEFVDIYRNNLNKTVMAYRWAVDNCLNTQYFFFVDDDFFVNVRNIIQYLGSKSVQSTRNLFIGHAIINAKPFRDKSSKWYTTLQEYPCDTYPPYLSGGAILISTKVAKLLKTAFPYVQYFHIDDVYLGMVAKKLNITPLHDDRFDVEHTSPMHLKDTFASHRYGDHRELLVLWGVFLDTMSLKSSRHISEYDRRSA